MDLTTKIATFKGLGTLPLKALTILLIIFSDVKIIISIKTYLVTSN